MPASRRVISFLFTLSVVLIFTLSGGVLWDLGLNYNGITGAMASKIHPGTYVAVFAFLLFVASRRNPAAILQSLAQRHKSSCIFLAIVGGILLFAMMDSRPGLAGLVDTFMLSVFLFLIMAELPPTTMDRLAVVLHILLAGNALLTLFEFASGTRLFPYRFEGNLLIDNRPEGLQNHPLDNSVVIGLYLTGLLSNGARDLPHILKPPAIVLQWAALMATGGRTAIVLINILIGYILLRRIMDLLAGKRISLSAWTICALIPPCLAIGLLALQSAGFFEASLQRFGDDGGSAQTRVQMFDIFSYISIQSILFSPDVEMVDSVRRAQGLELGIENPIIRLMLYQGLLATVLLLTGFTLFLREVTRTLQPGYGLSLIFFLAVIMSFESISSKSLLLADFTVLMGVMFRPPAYARVRFARRALGFGAVKAPVIGFS